VDVVRRTLTGRRHRGLGRARRRRDEAGFSLIEVLVASVILLVILLGIIPLFLRSMSNRQSGLESTAVGSYARTRAETLLELPFDHPQLTVPAGGDELEVVEYLPLGDREWTTDAGAADDAAWVRTTHVRQFGSGDLLDGDTDGDGDSLDRPLPGGTNPRSIQIKEIEVAVTSNRAAGALQAGEELTVRVLKAF
jgi:prepilin-type N-terminal cleavage/methylation domain-containing protein